MNNGINDIVIIGGGLAGLTAANYLARSGRRVTLLEKANQLGGRAMTREQAGFLFNRGPHALYVAGEGVAVLKELQIPFSGNKPLQGGGHALYNGQLHSLPATAVDFLRTRLFSMKDKMKVGYILGGLAMAKPESSAHLSLQEWVTQRSNSPAIQQYLFALARLSTYANAPEQLNAAVFIRQLQRALKGGVYYLDGGWQTLVAGLRTAAERAGVTILTGVRATAVSSDHAATAVSSDHAATAVSSDHAATAVSHYKTHTQIHLASGEDLSATAVVLAVDLKTAAQLLPENEDLAQEKETAVSVRAACLDIGLRRLPNPDYNFVLGLDQPLYLSVHSAAARLAPEGQIMLHVAKYLPLNETDPKRDRLELETLLDQVQPGWRGEVVAQQFLPKMTVVNRLVTKRDGGLNGRLPITLPNAPRIFLAGDWVGAEGWLADASFASGRAVAQRMMETIFPLENSLK